VLVVVQAVGMARRRYSTCMYYSCEGRVVEKDSFLAMLGLKRSLN